MSETYSNPLTSDEIIDDETTTAHLDRQADDILARGEARSFGDTNSIRQAVREDLGEGRAWARRRSELTQDAIRDEPLKAVVYALGAGVLIGLLLRR